MLVTANIFQPLIDVFEAVLKFFHNSGGLSWGWSIVALTVAVRLVLLPLAIKQFHSMQAMQRAAPQLKAIQNKYKEDKQRQQQEIMKFYKEEGINPFSSCLPLVAQLPVFIGLFYTLRKNLRPDICPSIQPHHLVNGHSVINLAHTKPCGPHNGAGFLFINDLTNKATGATLVVLLVLYVGSQLGYSWLMSPPTMDKTQRQIMMFMPLFFVVIIINFPAGLIMYWITTNLLMLVQQYLIRRRVGPVTPIVVAGAPPGGADGEDGEDGVESNGSGSGGIAGLLRGRKSEDKEPAGVGAGASRRGAVVPPPPPRKKKKRSGRRR